MGDDSHTRSLFHQLKNEWSLFWGSLSGDDEPTVEHELLEVDGLESLTLEDVRTLTRELSDNRRSLNQRLESLAKELELNNAKLESLRLVGAEDDETVGRIGVLGEEGRRLAIELARIDVKLRRARELEDRRRSDLTSA